MAKHGSCLLLAKRATAQYNHRGSERVCAEVENQKCRYNRCLNMLKERQSRADWQRKENITVKEKERERERAGRKKRICDWVSSTLLQTVHCFFIPPDIKAPSFLLGERKCYGAMAQFVTHIIWISAPLYFHKSCHTKKDSRETNGERATEREREREREREGLRGPTKKRSKEGKKRREREKRGIKRGRRLWYETCLIQSEWQWRACTRICVCICPCEWQRH